VDEKVEKLRTKESVDEISFQRGEEERRSDGRCW